MEEYLKTDKISIIMLTYNALEYVKQAIEGIHMTDGIEYEFIVFDNGSKNETVKYLNQQKNINVIDKLILNDKNIGFVHGNIEASKYVSAECTHILFINSDIHINNKLWLKKIYDIHKRGITGCQPISSENRPDGWCLLIDKDLYIDNIKNIKHLNWGWSFFIIGQKLQCDGYSVQTIMNYQKIISHYGGKSRNNIIIKDNMCNNKASEKKLHLKKCTTIYIR